MAGPLVVPPPPPGGPQLTQKTSEVIGTFRPTKASLSILSFPTPFFQVPPPVKAMLTYPAIQTRQARSLSHIPRLRRLWRILPSGLLGWLPPALQRQRRQECENAHEPEIRRPPRPLHTPRHIHHLRQHKRRRLHPLPLHPRQCLPALLPRAHPTRDIALPVSRRGHLPIDVARQHRAALVPLLPFPPSPAEPLNPPT